MNKRLGQLLLNDGLITIDQLNEALEYHEKNNMKIGAALLDCGHVTDETLSEYLSTQKKLREE